MHRSLHTRLLVALATCAVLGSPALAGVINSVSVVGGSGLTNVQSDAMAEDAVSYVDRTHEWNNVPSYLLGNDYVQTANNDRSSTTYQMTLGLSAPSTVYVLLDNRWDSTSMPWMAAMGFLDTGDDIGVDENGDGSINNTSSVFQASFEAGTVVLGAQASGGINMYGVVAAPGEAPPEPEPPSAASFYIDIGPENQRVQSGHIGAPDPLDAATPNNNQNGANVFNIPVVVDANFSFLMSISSNDANGNPDGGIDWRDRGDATPPPLEDLVMLGEDFVKNNSGTVRVDLIDLPAGIYDVTSFHADASNTQCPDIRVLVDIGEGFVDTLARGNANISFGGVNGLTMQELLDSSASFSFTLDQAGTASIIFDGNGTSDTEVPLSGLYIEYSSGIPEPASLALLGLGALALRRRRK